MNASQQPQLNTTEHLIKYAQDTFVRFGVLWAIPLVVLLEQHCSGLGGVWARQSVYRLLSSDSLWRYQITQLELYLEEDLYPETLQELANEIWYRAGSHSKAQNATARLYWGAAFERRGARREADVQHSMAIEIIVGEPPDAIERFAVALDEFYRLDTQCSSEQ